MLNFFWTALTSTLFIVDPLGVLPAFLVLTQGYSARQRRATGIRASLITTVTLAVFAGIGNSLFRVLGLTLPAFQIAGGLILFLVALDMIRAQRSTQESESDMDEAVGSQDVSVTPLAIPMLAGPAGLSTVTTLMAKADDQGLGYIVVVYLAIGITGLTTLLSLLVAEPLVRWLGRTGIHVFSRVLGVVLAGISVQFVLDGLHGAGLIPEIK
ncbi:MAG: MarC family protein [Gemmataceae bacterium]